MSGLARILLQKQLVVSGSDIAATPVTQALVKMGAKVHEGHDEQHLPTNATIIISSDIKQDNVEYQAAMKLKLPVMHRSDLLAKLMEGFKGLAITGTHGKTTTTSLLVWVLVHAGFDPSYAIGGWLPDLDTNACSGKGEFFVAEADESDGTFTKYKPFGGIITNIDHDHMSHFGTEAKLLNAFNKFAKSVASQEHFFWCGDDPLLRRLNLTGRSYGFSEKCALRVSGFSQQGWSSHFNLEWQETRYENIEVALTGRHNVLNAAAIFGLALTLGAPEAKIRDALKSFPGVKRRCERKSDRRGILVLDDYAHHPAEIQATLQGIRQAVGDRRIIAVFQPHRFSRTKHCLGQFKHVFDSADDVIITDIYAANEEPLPKVTAQSIVDEIESHSSIPVRYVPRNSLRTTLVASARPHDVIVTLGAGDITKLTTDLSDHFLEQSPKRWTVGVICGGASVEHDVSCLSAKQTLPHLKTDYYEVKHFGVTKEGKWLTGDDTLDKLANAGKVALDTQRGHPISPEVLAQLLTCDVLLPMLHGTNGEDGAVQGFLDVLGKAYVGCDQRSSSLCMDKVVTKQIAQAAGIPVVPCITFSKGEWQRDPDMIHEKITQTLTWPLYVKPRHLGSSIEVHRVTNSDEFKAAIDRILGVDTHVIVEAEMLARELEFAILGNEEPVVLPPGEIFSAGRIHTYAGKYGDQPTPDTTKAELSKELMEEGMSLAAKLFKAAGCSGLARADFFLDNENRYWLNEINTMPGFTKNSMFPRLCVDNNLLLTDVLQRLVILALARRRRLQRLSV